jgi:hypothetical protein
LFLLVLFCFYWFFLFGFCLFSLVLFFIFYFMKRFRIYNGGEVGGLLTASLGVKPSVEGRRLLHCVRNDGDVQGTSLRGTKQSAHDDGKGMRLLHCVRNDGDSCRNLTGFGNLLGLGGRIAAAVIAGIALLTAGLFGLNACHQGAEDVIPDTPAKKGAELSFRVSGSRPETYATQLTVGNLEAFCVNALLDSGVVSPESPKPVLLHQQTVARQFNSNTFSYEPRVYLPDSFISLIVTAFAPVHVIDSAGQFELADPYEAGHNAFYYSIPDPRGSLEQEDLLVAYTKIKAADVAGATAANVTLNFKHALSLVHVSVQNNTNATIIITKMELNNVLIKGLLDLDADDWAGPVSGTIDILDDYYPTPSSPSQYKTLWDLTNDPLTHEYGETGWFLGEGGVPCLPSVTADITNKDQGLLVLPQRLLSEGDPEGPSVMVISYSLNNLFEEQSFDLQKLIPAFEMGKQYKIEVTFNRASVGFAVIVDEWPVAKEIEPTE